MGILLRIILALVVVALIGLVGFSYYPGSLEPAQAPVSRPVSLAVE